MFIGPYGGWSLHASPVYLLVTHLLYSWRITYPAIQAVVRWSHTSPPSFSASPPSGLPCCNPKRFSPRAARWDISRGATGCSRRSPPASSSCDRCCLATPPVALSPMCRACGAARPPTVQPARHSHCASALASERASALRCSAPPWTTGDGMALVPVAARARGARGLLPRPSRTPSAHRRRRGRGAAAPWPTSGGSSRRAPVCS
jgi:hypothetical protein